MQMVMVKHAWPGILLISLFAILATLVNQVPPSRQYGYMTDVSQPLLLSHRGSRVLAPEHSLHAHKLALELGADVVEIDVRNTADRQLVVWHNATIVDSDGIHRVCYISKCIIVQTISNLTYDELSRIDSGYWFTVNGIDFPWRNRGLKVRTCMIMSMMVQIEKLETYFQAFPNSPLNIELKDTADFVVYGIHDLIVRYNASNRVAVMGVYCPSLQMYVDH